MRNQLQIQQIIKNVAWNSNKGKVFFEDLMNSINGSNVNNMGYNPERWWPPPKFVGKPYKVVPLS